MKILSIDEIPRSAVHSTLLRFVLASPSGLDERWLSEPERLATAELESLGLVKGTGSGRIHADWGSGALSQATELVLEAKVANLEMEMEDAARRDRDEFERLLVEHKEILELLGFIRDLTRTVIRSKSVADLFHSSFLQLEQMVRFGAGIGVTLEQNLDLYLLRSPEHGGLFGERLIGTIRESLARRIPVSFEATDVILRGDFADLETWRGKGDILKHSTFSFLRQEERTTGLMLIFRDDPPFELEETRVLDLLSSQVSMVLGNIRAQEQIQNLADTDDLTGVWNKRYFRRILPAEIERARTYSVPLSLVMFDLDNFKEINDRFGHSMGDVVLSELCGAVKESLRPPDLFARFGGDEFAIILPHTDLWGARSLADRIIRQVRELEIPTPDDDMLRCSISMGIATWTPPDMSATDLLELADQRLYDSKNSGKDRYSW